MDQPCDSGYGSEEGENEESMDEDLESENDISNHTDSENYEVTAEIVENTYVASNIIEECNLILERREEKYCNSSLESSDKDNEDDDISFPEWLKKVAGCLEGRKKGDPEKMDVVEEKLTESERCMNIARSVLDEETVLEMINTFLQMTKVFFTIIFIKFTCIFRLNFFVEG